MHINLAWGAKRRCSFLGEDCMRGHLCTIIIITIVANFTRQEVAFVKVVSSNSQPMEGAGLPWATHTRKTVELTSTVSFWGDEITIVTSVDSAAACQCVCRKTQSGQTNFNVVPQNISMSKILKLWSKQKILGVVVIDFWATLQMHLCIPTHIKKFSTKDDHV